MDTQLLAKTGSTRHARQEDTRVLTNDNAIRKVLKARLMAAFSTGPHTLVLEELGLRHGATRVDLVVVNGYLHGFEVKSDRDSLKRLPRQVEIYSEVLDYVTLVVGQRHAEKAELTIPGWWGLQTANAGQDGKVVLQEVRGAAENPNPNKLAIAKLLWRDEAIGLLEEVGAADGVRSKPRRVVYARLAEVIPIDALRSRVRHQLKSRTDWRSDAPRKSYGG
jgi:hypothetical protein